MFQIFQFQVRMCAMVLILDGNSEHLEHVWRKPEQKNAILSI